MILEIIQFLPLKDFLLVAVLFGIYVIGTGSLFHYFVTERQYRKLNNKQPTKKPRKTSRTPAKATKSTKTALTTRRAKTKRATA